MKKEKKAILGWALYDWANSAFATTVMSGFFPLFFKQYWSFGVDVNASTARLGFGNAAAGLMVALMAPILGTVADKGSCRKKFLILFAYIGVLATAALYFIEKGAWVFALFFYAIGVIGFSGANIFYDALLPDISNEKNIDTVSGFGFSLGYLGGGLLFLFNVIMVLYPGFFGIGDAAKSVQIGFLSVSIWWGLFTLFIIKWTPEKKEPQPEKNGLPVAESIRQLKETFGKIKKMKPVFLFLIAYWFYIDGVDTIIRMAVDYGMSLGFGSNDLITALLITQFVGFPAALLFGMLGQRWGAKKGIFVAIWVYMAVTVWGAMMDHKTEFYILAIVVGLVQGGIQALSRSYYARLIPSDQPAEFFGFYNMLGKFAAIIGPFMMGAVGLMVRRILLPPDPTSQQLMAVGRLASRWSISSVLILFIVGGVLLWFVDEKDLKDH